MGMAANMVVTEGTMVMDMVGMEAMVVDMEEDMETNMAAITEEAVATEIMGKAITTMEKSIMMVKEVRRAPYL